MAPKGRELQARQFYIDGARRHSDKNFLVMPSHELQNTIMGMHTDILFSRPTYYLPRRAAGEPFTENIAPYGKVYRLGSPADLQEMLKQENAIISLPDRKSTRLNSSHRT